MKVLVACEYSGRVRDAFLDAGHHAVSCDLMACESQKYTDKTLHHQGDVMEIIDDGWDLMIAHPPFTYLSVSGMHWTTRGLRDPKLTEDALEFAKALMQADIPRIAVENPISIISSRIRKPDQIVQPWMFGEDASKKTCLWLKNLPLLTATSIVEPRIVEGKKRWANQTDSGQNRLSPSPDRWKIRSLTCEGLAKAMAEQWGNF